MVEIYMQPSLLFRTAKFDANPIMHDMHIMIRKIGDDDALILLLLMISPKMMVRRRKRSEVKIKSE